jgi:hypothetical protein
MSRTDVLVTAEWAELNLDNPNVVFVEVDEDTTAYDGGHIEGAVKLDWKTDLQDPVRRDFVNQDEFSRLLSERGISNDDTVILYGGNNNWFAAYAYWYFQALRPRQGQAARRRPREVGARWPSADRGGRHPAGHRVQGTGARQQHSCVPRRGPRRHRQQESRRRPLTG